MKLLKSNSAFVVFGLFIVVVLVWLKISSSNNPLQTVIDGDNLVDVFVKRDFENGSKPIKADMEYLDLLTINYSELSKDVLVLKTNFELDAISDIKQEIHLVFEIRDGSDEKIEGEWQKISFDTTNKLVGGIFLIPKEKLNIDSKFKLYIWNPNRITFEINNLKVSFQEDFGSKQIKSLKNKLNRDTVQNGSLEFLDVVKYSVDSTGIALANSMQFRINQLQEDSTDSPLFFILDTRKQNGELVDYQMHALCKGLWDNEISVWGLKSILKDSVEMKVYFWCPSNGSKIGYNNVSVSFYK